MTATTGPDPATVERARAGDEDAFAAVVAPWRRELHAHCYRMLGSAHDADDAVQETLVRAWLGMGRFAGRSSVRTWLHTIAHRVSLDAAESRGRRALPVDLGPASERAVVDDPMLTEVAWLGPYPGPTPEDRVENRESVELAFVAALQHLPGNQRAALVMFEVLGFSAREIAEAMGTTTASVNSALQRARAQLAAAAPGPSQQTTLRALGDEALTTLVTRYARALERGDADALLGLLTEDVSWSMPPMAHWYAGVGPVTDFLVRMPLTVAWRHRLTWANGQPAVAGYRWDDATGVFTGFVVDVLTLRDDRVAAVTAFIGPEHVAACGLPAHLPADEPMTPAPAAGPPPVTTDALPTDPTDVVRAVFAAYLAQDRERVEDLLDADLVFSSPQDDFIDRAAYLERCFPTADRVREQVLTDVVDLGDGQVFVRYRYELHSGARHRNTEVITVRDGRLREIQVYFGAELTARTPG